MIDRFRHSSRSGRWLFPLWRWQSIETYQLKYEQGLDREQTTPLKASTASLIGNNFKEFLSIPGNFAKESSPAAPISVATILGR